MPRLIPALAECDKAFLSCRQVLIKAVLFFSAMLLCLMLFTPARLAQAQAIPQPLPPVNLGFTTFFDGMPPPPGPGLVVQEYWQFYHSYTFKDGFGHAVPIFPDLDVFIALTQISLISKQKVPLLNAYPGFDLLVPVVLFSEDLDIGDGGLGDLIIGPSLQWDPVMGKRGPIFAHRLELNIAFPTGSYNDKDILNAGSNIYSINPYWAVTVFPTPKWELSGRFHYLWNSRNNSPNTLLFPGAEHTQPGQAFHMNFASSYEVIPQRLRLGVNQYYLKQLTDAKVDGVSVPYTRQQVLGLGIGGMLSFGLKDAFVFNTYAETLARNRPQGYSFLIRYFHHFGLGI